MRWVKALVALLLIAGLGISIGGGSPAQKRSYIIYVVVGGTADRCWEVLLKGVEDYCAMYEDLWCGCFGPPVYCNNPEEFLRTLEPIARKNELDGLVTTLTAPEAMDKLLRPAIARGVAVIAVNIPDLREPPKRIPVLTYIGEDFYFTGVTAAKETLKRFTPKRAAFLNHHPGARHIYLRGKGYCDVMTENGIPCEQVDITEDPIKGAEITAAYLTAHPDCDALFISNTRCTEAIIPRLEDEGYKVGIDVKIAQKDMSPKILDYIQEGKIMFTMDQEKYLQGYMGVEFAYLKVKYDFTPPPAPVRTLAVITAKDIPRVKDLIKEGYRCYYR